MRRDAIDSFCSRKLSRSDLLDGTARDGPTPPVSLYLLPLRRCRNKRRHPHEPEANQLVLCEAQLRLQRAFACAFLLLCRAKPERHHVR